MIAMDISELINQKMDLLLCKKAFFHQYFINEEALSKLFALYSLSLFRLFEIENHGKECLFNY